MLNNWTHADLISVQMMGLVHPEFSSVAQRNEKFWANEFGTLQQADYGREDGMVGYAWVARYTEKFLDAYLKENVQASQYLKSKPAAVGVPPHVLSVNFRPAQPRPPSLQSFEETVGHEGFDHAAEIYARMRKEQPEFNVAADDIDAWGYELLSNSHVHEATEIMKLEVQMKGSSQAYMGLGEAYRVSGQRRLAVAAYRHALALEPTNTYVKDIITALDEPGASRE